MIIQTLRYPNKKYYNQNIYSKQHACGRFQWFTKIFEIAKMTANHKHTVLSIVDKITICECHDNGSSKREIAYEYKITISIYFMYICLIIHTF